MSRVYIQRHTGFNIHSKVRAESKEEFERMDYLEFIARVTSHIPDKGQVIIRYYGLYSNAHRGKIRKTEVDPSHGLVKYCVLFLILCALTSEFSYDKYIQIVQRDKIGKK